MTLAEKLIADRRHEQETRGYATSSRWYTSLSNAISFLERAETAKDPKEHFFEAWLAAYNLMMMHGGPGDDEFKRFNRWVTTVIDVPRIRELIQDPSLAHFRDAVRKAEKTLLFDTEKKRPREGRQHLEAWSKGALSADKAIRYFLIIIRDIRNGCAHAEFNPGAAVTKKALSAAGDALIPIVAAAIRATIEHPVEGTTGRTTAYRSILWPYIINSDSIFSDYYLERLFPNEELIAFPEDEAKTRLKEIAKRVDLLRASLASADVEETKREWCEAVLFSSLGINAKDDVKIVGQTGVFEPDYVLAQGELSPNPHDEYQGKHAGTELACLIWVLPWRSELDAVRTNGEGDVLPMELVQRALTASDVQWAVLTNGKKLRLLHKSTAHKPRSFLELDLAAVMDRRDADAVLAFRYCLGLFSGASFTEKDDHGRTRLDRAVIESERHGKEISDELKQNVFHALEELGDGFIAFLRAKNDDLKSWREKKEFSGSLDSFLHSDELLTDIYHESLSMMYRLLFLFYAEGRNLLTMENEMYRESYSLESIRDDIISVLDDPDPKSFFGKGNTSLWDRLKELFGFVDKGWGDIIPAYNGGLFDPEQHEFLERFQVGDHYLARAIDLLSRTRPRFGQQRGEGRKKITYRDLEIRHLGSIYEGILEYSALIADEDKVVITRGSGSKAADEYASVSELNKDEKQQLSAWQEAVEENPESPRLPRACKIAGFKEKGRYFLVSGGRESKRKSSGSYYTPDYIVQYIVENTIGPFLRGETRDNEMSEGPTSDQILELKILDPAMGSGHFLVAATEYLARAYGDALIREGKNKDGLMSGEQFIRYKRIVAERCIYGVDINPMAVELAKLSMWLFTMDRGRPLSFLDHHLKCGNSLIGAWIDELAEPPELDPRGRPRKRVASTNLNLFEARFRERVPLMVRDLFGIMSLETLTSKDVELKKQLDHAVERTKRPFNSLADIFIGTYFGEDANDYHSILLDLNHPLNRSPDAARTIHAFHWELEFPEVFFDTHGRHLGDAGFQVLISNPPYVRIQRIDHQQADYLYQVFETPTSKADLSLVFIEQALRLASKFALIGYICTSQWIATDYGKNLRRLLLNGQLHEIVDFDSLPVFENAETYPAIVLLSPTSADDLRLKRIHHERDLNISAIEAAPIRSIPFATLSQEPWNLRSLDILSVLHRTNISWDSLESFGKAHIGVLTGMDAAFVVNREICKGMELETEVLFPYAYRGAEIERYTDVKPQAFVIYPYVEDSAGRAVLIDELELKRSYPNVHQYLSSNKKTLQLRQDSRAYYAAGRDWYRHLRAGTFQYIRVKKLLFKGVDKRASVGLLGPNTAFNGANCPGIILGDLKEYSWLYILGVLNSKVMTYHLRAICPPKLGGYTRFNATNITNAPIRRLDFSDRGDRFRHDRMVELVGSILKLNKQLAVKSETERTKLRQQIETEDQAIDQVIYELYGLADTEVAVIEESIAEL